jgi:hypothetical protein
MAKSFFEVPEKNNRASPIAADLECANFLLFLHDKE